MTKLLVDGKEIDVPPERTPLQALGIARLRSTGGCHGR